MYSVLQEVASMITSTTITARLDPRLRAALCYLAVQ